MAIAYAGGRNDYLGVVQEVNWDRDFCFPFLSMLALLLALGQRTNWFRMSSKQSFVRDDDAPTPVLLEENEKKKKLE